MVAKRLKMVLATLYQLTHIDVLNLDLPPENKVQQDKNLSCSSLHTWHLAPYLEPRVNK